MDIDETYKEILRLIGKHETASLIDDAYEHLEDIATQFRDLDEWMKAGGYPPVAWHVPCKDDI